MWLLPKHHKVSIFNRMFWSIAAFIPFFGPLFYGAFYRIPSKHKDGGAPINTDAFYGGPGRP